MIEERIARLQEEMRKHDVDCVTLIAGTNLRYLTGLDFHLSERPVGAFIPAEGTPTFAVPALEATKFADGPLAEVPVFTYDDTGDPQDAFREAMMLLPEVRMMAVEYLRMRVRELNLMRRQIPAAALSDAGPLMDALRLTKSADEIERMRRAIAITEGALAEVVANVEAGMTEREIAGQLAMAQLARGGGEVPFLPITLIGERAALPHGVPGDRALTPGDVLLIDFGTSYEGYVSDLTRTFFFGAEPTERQRAIYEAVLSANFVGRAAAGPGVAAMEVDKAARDVIGAAGFGEYFTHRVGHGLGMEGHENPSMHGGNTLPLAAGMTFTVEPGIYVPGEIGVRIEDNLVVTERGADTLTTFSRNLQVIGV